MAYNKIIYNNRTLIDLTGDTVDANSLTKGTTAHDKSGAKITGVLETPSGTITITNNGIHVVKNYANANVNVPIPAGYIKPEGTKKITANGTTDVTSYASVNVNVAQNTILKIDGVQRTGTYNFTTEIFKSFPESTLPESPSSEFFLHNGKICFNHINNIYQYNESSKTWSQIASGLDITGQCKVCSINGTLVAVGNPISSSWCYFSYYNGTSWSSVTQVPDYYQNNGVTLVVYKNTLYLVGAGYYSYSDDNYNFAIMKWVDSNKTFAWVKSIEYSSSTQYYRAVVHNNLMYIFRLGGGYNVHTFDGTTVDTKYKAVSPFQNGAMYSYNGELHSIVNGSNYILNTSDYTLSIVETFPTSLYYAIVYNGVIYASNSKDDLNFYHLYMEMYKLQS